MKGNKNLVGTFRGIEIYTSPDVEPGKMLLINHNELYMEQSLLEEALEHLEQACEILNATDIVSIEFGSHEGNGTVRWNKPYGGGSSLILNKKLS